MAAIQHFPPEENYENLEDYSDSSSEIIDYPEEQKLEPSDEDANFDTGVSGTGKEGGMAAMIAAAANRMAQSQQKRLDSNHKTALLESKEDDDHHNSISEETTGAGGMAALIAAAASKRRNRIDMGGELRIRELPPAPQKKLDTQGFAAMAAAAATKRNDRIENGGHLRITEISDIPEEHSNVFVNIAEEAAKVGRLVCSNEYVVVAESTKQEEGDTWNGPGGLKNSENRRSMFERAINEAAALGRMKAQKYDEFTNYNHSMYDDDDKDIDIDKQVDEHGRKALRTHFLLDQHVRDEKKEKREQWTAPESFEEPIYTSIEDVKLPTQKIPTFKPKTIKFKSQREVFEALSNEVAVSAWDRNFRLQRPKAQLRVTRNCRCPYCKSPNPYQTHKYKQLMFSNSTEDIEIKPKSWRTGDEIEEEEISPYLKPPKGKIYKLFGHCDETEIEDLEDDHQPEEVSTWDPPKQPSIPALQSISISPAQPPEPEIESLQILDVPIEALSSSLAGQSGRDGEYYISSSTGTRVLLDESIDFGTVQRKVYIKKEKKKKEKEKQKVEMEKEKDAGCVIM